MDFFKVRKLRNGHKSGEEKDKKDEPVSQHEEPKNENGRDDLSKSVHSDPPSETEDDDDDDFITNEVKKRLKELRRNSFMALIPEEESCPEEEEEETVGETSSSEWRDVEAEGRQWWRGFDAVYEKYCERMAFFDRLSSQQLDEVGKATDQPYQHSTPSPRSASKKLASPLRCLSLKKLEELDDETEHLQQQVNNPYQDIETAYVGQICLAWEALHCQYTQMRQKISSHPQSQTSYNYSAQQFQEFQVLLQRFIENEPFEPGFRAQIYARTRNMLSKLLQIPNIQGFDQQTVEDKLDMIVFAPELTRIIENSILTFDIFLKTDQKRPINLMNMFGNQNQFSTPLQQIQSSHDKKAVKLNEQRNRRKGWKKKCWPKSFEDVQLLLSLIDLKVVSMVLRMVRITNEQLIWCEEKMKKIDLSDGMLRRDPSPILFPC